ncbi:hypothetical protein [Enterococcus rivorum]|uniref:hypothetical protein n=1 Tax=Enterococcus rivorum TaxID=762845 RepID=UPI00084F0DD5|nr:hypothetical protein [Enterococcus rivorum]MBP2099996.1 hypothetical protein [Enterococcus rivorum]
MNYVLDSYTAYFVEAGVLEKIWEIMNWIFVDIPFVFLRVLTSIFLLFEKALDQSEFFRGKQVEAYYKSVEILNNFGGRSISKGSLFALLFLISAFYLLYRFFVSRKNFSKILLYYVGVIVVFIFWFGNVSTSNGVSQSGGTFLISSVSNITKEMRAKISNATSPYSSGDSLENEDSPLFNATVRQTFYYVNTGSLDGTMPNGEKIDEKKLLMPVGASSEEKKKFEAERKKYIEEQVKENAYLEQNGKKTIEKFFSIIVGNINLVVISIPVNYMQALLTIIEILVIMILIAFPVILLCAFIPACQNILFKTLKGLMGLLFFPVILGVFMSIFFWVNYLIDTAFMGVFSKVDQTLLFFLSSGTSILAGSIILIVIKIVLLRKVWKNRYAILRYFSDGKVEMPNFEQKILEAKDRAVEFGGGIFEAGVGAYTGNPNMAMDGLSKMNTDDSKFDKALSLGNEHFIEENEKGEEETESLIQDVDEPINEMETMYEIDDAPFEEIAGDEGIEDRSLDVYAEMDGLAEDINQEDEALVMDDLDEMNVIVDNVDEFLQEDEKMFFDRTDEELLQQNERDVMPEERLSEIGLFGLDDSLLKSDETDNLLDDERDWET